MTQPAQPREPMTEERRAEIERFLYQPVMVDSRGAMRDGDIYLSMAKQLLREVDRLKLLLETRDPPSAGRLAFIRPILEHALLSNPEYSGMLREVFGEVDRLKGELAEVRSIADDRNSKGTDV